MPEASFEQMKMLLERSPVAMLMTAGADQRIVFLNDKFTELFGYTLAEVPDIEHWWPLAYPDEAYRAEVQAEWAWKWEKSARDRKDIEPVEAMVTCRDGSRKYIVFHLSPIESGTKNLVTFFDVTQRRREQLAFSEAERRYRELFESSRDGFVIVDSTGRIIDCNRAYTAMLGYTPDELKKMRSFEEITPEKWRGWERTEIWDNRLLGSGFSDVYEKEYIRKDGSIFPVELSAHAVRDEQGELKYLWGIARDITEKKRSEDALLESEQRHRMLIEMLQEGVWEIDRDANTTFVNGPMAEMLGYPVEEMSGRHLFSFMDEEGIARAKALLQRRERGIAEQHEFEFIRKDGERIQTLLEASPILDLHGNFQGAVAGVIDITQRKQVESRLRDSEVKYRTLVDMADDAILLTAPDGRILSANPGACRMFGRTEEEICRLGRAGMVVQDEKMKKAVAERERTGSTSAELNMIKGDGTIIPVDVSSVVFQTDGEQRTSMVIRDISVRKRQERALKESERRYRSLFEGIKDMVITTTLDGKILDINPAGVEQIGYETKEELLQEAARTQQFYADPRDREPIIEELRSRGYVRDAEISMRRRNGEIFMVSASMLPTLDKAGNIVALRGIFRDITERRRLEEQLRQSQKTESIGRLAAGVAHEFNNLLTSIQGYIDLALMQLPEDSPIRRELSTSRNSCILAGNITRELLIFSRQQQSRPQVINLAPVIEEHINLMSRLIGERYQIMASLADDLWAVNADSSQLGQVIMNLILNAEDAMPEGGVIEITATNSSIDSQQADGHSGGRPGDFVHLVFRDTGTGMDEETLSHIFDPFFTTKAPAESSGLGLPVIDGIIAQHDGWIEVESAPGRGTAFSIYLPAVSKPARGKPAQVTGKAVLSGHGEKILLVEDEEPVRKMAEKILTRNGYEVTAAATAEEAAELFEREKGDFNLVFSDVVLPKESGIELVERLLEQKPDLGILLASGYSDATSADVVRARGFTFLEKPYQLEILLQNIANILKTVS